MSLVESPPRARSCVRRRAFRLRDRGANMARRGGRVGRRAPAPLLDVEGASTTPPAPSYRSRPSTASIRCRRSRWLDQSPRTSSRKAFTAHDHPDQHVHVAAQRAGIVLKRDEAAADPGEIDVVGNVGHVFLPSGIMPRSGLTRHQLPRFADHRPNARVSASRRGGVWASRRGSRPLASCLLPLACSAPVTFLLSPIYRPVMALFSRTLKLMHKPLKTEVLSRPDPAKDAGSPCFRDLTGRSRRRACGFRRRTSPSPPSRHRLPDRA
jgi:hypothetical protein